LADARHLTSRQASGGDRHLNFYGNRDNLLTTGQAFEGTAFGDQIVLTTQLLKGDTEVGHQGGVCTVISVARAETQCVPTYPLPRRADHRPGADRPW
jgi:hypothetical protein